LFHGLSRALGSHVDRYGFRTINGSEFGVRPASAEPDAMPMVATESNENAFAMADITEPESGFILKVLVMQFHAKQVGTGLMI